MDYRILIVEDDKGIAKAIQTSIQNWQMDAKTIGDFQNVLQEFDFYKPHLVLMDISLPYMNGHYWCQKIREVSNVPILFISSTSDNMNIIMAINMGGDDFIAKPFDQMVLIAKIQAMLRRTYGMNQMLSIIEDQDVILNTGDGSVSYQNKKIELSKNEYRILLVLMQNKGKIVSREKLMDALWQTDCFIDENTLTVNVNRLRKKLEGQGLKDYIHTKHGMGYMIEG